MRAGQGKSVPRIARLHVGPGVMTREVIMGMVCP